MAIDPGANGFLAVRTDEKIEYYAINGGDMLDLADFIRKFSEKDNKVCVMEEVHAIFGSSAKATFSFGEINGYIKGILTALRIPYTLVPPKEWQKELWVNQDMVYDNKQGNDGKPRRVVNTKQTSYNAARRLFPNEDFRKSARCRNWDDNKVDSILISEYAKRKNI